MTFPRLAMTAALFGAALFASACSSHNKNAGDGMSTGAPMPGTQQDLAVNIGDRVFFGYDKYDLSADAKSTLARQAEWLKKYSNLSVTIEGHTDERGTREYNLALGDRRANSARDYLVSMGIPSSRITTISYGEERPESGGSDEASWAQNRRAVTVVTGGVS